MKVILIFVDGLGVGENDAGRNPCAAEGIRLLGRFRNGTRNSDVPGNGILVPTDASLDINGLPQSATGQVTILTGVNAGKVTGRHVQGFPNDALRQILKSHSIFRKMREAGFAPAFINAYRPPFFTIPESLRWRLSATTVAVLAAGLPFFNLEDLKNGLCIYHDMTNEGLRAGGFGVPVISVEKAAEILAGAAERYDFVLYEYFKTDQAGHSQDMGKAQAEIRKLERFVACVLNMVGLDEVMVMVTSDHGNIEDLSIKTHTMNPAMTVIWGRGHARTAGRIRRLEDIAPALLQIMKEEIS